MVEIPFAFMGMNDFYLLLRYCGSLLTFAAFLQMSVKLPLSCIL